MSSNFYTIETFKGKVVKKFISRKFGYEKEPVNAIITDNGREFVLRREGVNVFQDEVLNSLEGKRISATGVIHSYVFIVNEFKEE